MLINLKIITFYQVDFRINNEVYHIILLYNLYFLKVILIKYFEESKNNFCLVLKYYIIL